MRFLERISLLTGSILVALAGLAWADGFIHSHSAVAEFDRIKERAVAPADQVAWSERRKTEYRASLSKQAGSTLSVLRISSTGIEVPVFDSTSKTALNRGAGHIVDSALPGMEGNIAIAGHRDGFFRGLKNITVGAEIQLITIDGQQNFRVAELMIVDPLDVSVLEPTDKTVITLVTCYPFHFVGAAPERFIVRATLLEPSGQQTHQR